jgi:hypothetical protein
MYPCAAPRLNGIDAYVSIHKFNPQVILEITDLAAFSGSLALPGKNKTASQNG